MSQSKGFWPRNLKAGLLFKTSIIWKMSTKINAFSSNKLYGNSSPKNNKTTNKKSLNSISSLIILTLNRKGFNWKPSPEFKLLKSLRARLIFIQTKIQKDQTKWAGEILLKNTKNPETFPSKESRYKKRRQTSHQTSPRLKLLANASRARTKNLFQMKTAMQDFHLPHCWHLTF